MATISRSSIPSIIVVVILVLLLPGAIWRIITSGDPYLFTSQFFQDILARLSGPGRLRFVLQPVVAIVLGVRGGIKDAEGGLPPVLLALAVQGEHRRELLRSALASTRNLLAIAVLLDLVSQYLIFHEVRPGAALVVGPLLIGVPYAMSRALSNRMWN
jgi:hypothetical protein